MKMLSCILFIAAFFYHQYAKKPANKAGYNIRITFKSTVGNEDMQLGAIYHNAFGEEFTIRTFKYYISNIEFKRVDGKVIKTGGYYLVNQADTASASFTIAVNDNRLSSISFLVGVDSMRNVSGTQTGDLDPAKGMFWTWNTGYIMAKLEAVSPASSNPNNNVTYHIGGFKNGEDVIRNVSLDLDKQHTCSEIIIQADAGKWFNAVHQLKISEHSACAGPGELAIKFADNYARMFKISEVKH